MNPRTACIRVFATVALASMLLSCQILGQIDDQATTQSAGETSFSVPSETMIIEASTDTPEPTAEAVFSAGIPETLQGCNRMRIYNDEGILDRELITLQMEKLIEKERAYLEENGFDGADISRLTIVQNVPFSEPERFPYEYLRAEGTLIPTSCTLVDDNQGGWRMMIGMTIKQKNTDTAVAILHVLADHTGLSRVMEAQGEGEKFAQKYTPEAIFAGLAGGPRWYIVMRPWVPSEDENIAFFADWQVSHDLVVLNRNAPVVLNAYMVGLALDPSEPSENIERLEKMIFPAQLLAVTAVQ